MGTLGGILFLSLVLVGLLLFCRKFPPTWHQELPKPWQRLVSLATGVAAIVMVVVYETTGDFPLFERVVVTMAVMVVTFNLVVGTYTDFHLRLADRKLLYLSTLLTGGGHLFITFLPGHGAFLLISWTIFLLFAVMLIFLPAIMGPSDARALLLIAASCFPILGVGRTEGALLGTVILVVAYALYHAWRSTKGARTGRTFLRSFLSSRSNPLVPFLLAPALLLTIYTILGG